MGCGRSPGLPGGGGDTPLDMERLGKPPALAGEGCPVRGGGGPPLKVPTLPRSPDNARSNPPLARLGNAAASEVVRRFRYAVVGPVVAKEEYGGTTGLLALNECLPTEVERWRPDSTAGDASLVNSPSSSSEEAVPLTDGPGFHIYLSFTLYMVRF